MPKLTRVQAAMRGPDPLDDIARGVRALLDHHGLTAHGWTFEWDRAVRRAGCCRHKTKRITLSKPIFAITPDAWRETALHEIAHALAGYGAGHGPQWQRIARELGIAPDRCHALPTPPGKIAGHCGCDTPHSRTRMPKGRFRCRNCRHVILWTER